MKSLFLIGIFIFCVCDPTFSQNRIGVFYCISYSAPKTYDFGNYAKNLYSKNFNNPDASRAFYKDLLDYNGKWDYTGFGCWVLAANKKRFNFYVTAGITAMGYNSIYDAGLSDNYPYLEFGPLPPGKQLYMYKKISLNILTVGLKTEFRLNNSINIEITPSYCFNSHIQNKFVFTKYSYKTVWNTAFVGGEYVYPDLNPKGIISGFAGFNFRISEKFKFHLLYMHNITGASAGDKNDSFRYRYRYKGISLQLSYSFLNLKKNS